MSPSRVSVEAAKLAQLEDWKRRAIMFDGGPELLSHQQMHRFHVDEPYIGCLFCRDQFVPAAAARAVVEAQERFMTAAEGAPTLKASHDLSLAIAQLAEVLRP